MPTSYIQMDAHFVWATWDRKPSLLPEWEERLYAAIASAGEQIDCPVYAVNGMADHLHVLVRLNANTTLAAVAHRLKGTTSHLINQTFSPPEPFCWQGAYAAFAVEKASLHRVRAYILNQKAHHSDNTCIPDWERTEE